jgi:hypothetical protein
MDPLGIAAISPGRVDIDLTDLTDDSDGSVCEIQDVSPGEPIIKPEPSEENTSIVGPAACMAETDVKRSEASFLEQNHAPNGHTASKTCEPAESPVIQPNIQQAGPSFLQINGDQTNPATLPIRPQDEVTEIGTSEKRPRTDSSTFGQVADSPDKVASTQPDSAEVDTMADHIDERQDDALFIPVSDNGKAAIAELTSDRNSANLVDALQSAPADHFEERKDGAITDGLGIFSNNDVTVFPEGANFDPLPIFDPSPNANTEFPGFDALLQYNQNKAELGEDSEIIADVAPDGIVGGYTESAYAENAYAANAIAEGSPEPLGGRVNDDKDITDWDSTLEKAVAVASEQAAIFATRKKQYEQKRANGTNTQEDDIRFTAEESAEQRRLRDIERSQMVLEDLPERTGLPPGYEEEESLFVPEHPRSPDPRSPNPQSPEPQGLDPQSLEPQPKKRAAPKARNRLSKKEVDDAISAGIHAGFGVGRKPKRKARASSEDRQPRKRRETNKTNGSGVKKPAPKRGRKRRPIMSNIASLGRTNIVEAAQANALRPDMPTFTATNKAKALQELIASLPSAERGTAGSDRSAIMEATMKFRGKGAVRSDGRGGWLLKGMESSLYMHQLLGTAFLRDRETGDGKPKGGLVCDEMGFGKTIQMM